MNEMLTYWLDQAAGIPRLRGSSFKVAYIIARGIRQTGEPLCMSDLGRHGLGHRRSVQRAAVPLIHLGLALAEQRGTRVVLLPALKGVALPLFAEPPLAVAAE